MDTIPRDERKISDLVFLSALDTGHRGLAGLCRAADSGDLPSAKAALVEHFRTRSRPRWIFDLRDGRRGRIPSSWHGHGPDIIERADAVLKNCFHLVADLSVDFGPNLNWRTAKMRSRHADSTFLKWNNFLRELAIAYARTGRAAYARKFDELVNRWLNDWPLVVDRRFTPERPHFSQTDGHKAMPTAFRVISWLDALYSGICFSPHVSPETTFRLLKSMWFTAIQYRRFERNPYKPANHHLWECGVAPFIFATMLPEFPSLRTLAERGRQAILEHADQSFLEDGGYEERSAGYTRVALKMFLMAVKVARANRVRLLDTPRMRRIKRCFENVAGTTLPDGCQPDVGDNRPSRVRNAKILGEAATHFQSRAAATVLRSLKLVELADPEDRPALEALPSKRMPLAACRPNAGYFVARDAWSPKASAMALSIPPEGSRRNHAHDDALSLQVVVRGVPFVGTPITELYGVLNTREMAGKLVRRHFYAMTSHNVILVEGRPARPLSDFTGFGREPTPVVFHWRRRPNGVLGEGVHQGYPGFVVRRQVAFRFRKHWTVRDTVLGRSSKPHLARWHFEYGVEVARRPGGFEANSQGKSLHIHVRTDARLRTRLYRDTRWLGSNPLRPGQPAPWVLDVRFGEGKDVVLETTFTLP